MFFSTPCPTGNKIVMEEFIKLHSYCRKLSSLVSCHVFFLLFHLLTYSSPDSFPFPQYYNFSLARLLISLVTAATLHQTSD